MVGNKKRQINFEEIRHDEMGHRDAFKIPLAKLKS
jgi:rubrerythrin